MHILTPWLDLTNRRKNVLQEEWLKFIIKTATHSISAP